MSDEGSTLDDVPPLPPRDEDKPIRRYHCSKCGERGHSARTCGRKPIR